MTQILAKEPSKLILIGRNKIKLEALKNLLKENSSKATISLDINDVKNCDIIVTATSFPGALLGNPSVKINKLS